MAADTQASEETRKNVDAILDHFLTSGGVVKDAHGIEDKEMEAVYAVGYNLYKAGKLDDALKVFRFLVFFDHLEKKYWMGLGATQHLQGKYEDAINAYSYAALLDMEDPRAALHAAECHLAMGNKVEAESALNAVLEFAPSSSGTDKYRERAEAFLSLMEKQDAGGDGAGKEA